MKHEFSISLMCADLLDLKKQLEKLSEKADYFHVDIMDGHFCKNITLSPDFVKSIRPYTKLPIDTHLMCVNPNDFIEKCGKFGSDIITVHAETINTDAFRVLNQIKSFGCKTGVVLNPATPLDYIKHYANQIDILTIMTVDVGYAGQSFINEMLDKIEQAAIWKREHGFTYKIKIDGSCNEKTFAQLKAAGAEVFVLGHSGLFALDDDVSVAFDKMLDIFNKC